MKSFLGPASMLIFVATVIAVAMQVRDLQPQIRIRSVQTIAIDPATELERDIQQ